MLGPGPDAGLDEVFLFLVVTLVVAGELLGEAVELEVGRGGVEEQDVDLQVQEVGDREEDLLLQLGKGVHEQVHRPVARVVGECLEPFDVDPARHPRQAFANLRQLQVTGVVADGRDDLLCRLAATEQQGEGSVNLSIDEEPFPLLLYAHLTHVVLAQKLQHRLGTVQVLVDADRPKELLLNRHRCMCVEDTPFSSVGQHDPLDTSLGRVGNRLVRPFVIGKIRP